MKKQFFSLPIRNARNIPYKSGIRSCSFLFLFLSFLILPGYAQQKKELAGGVTAFYESLKPAKTNAKVAASARKLVKVKGSETVALQINNNRQTTTGEVFIGKVENNKNSYVFFTFKDGEVKGKVILPDQKKAYTYTSENGNVWVAPEDLNKALCTEYKEVAAISSPSSSGISLAPPFGSSAYDLQSLPGATAVVLLDFDGHDATGSYWGNIIAQPAQVSESDIVDVWQVVSEDYSIYDLNITTSESVYQAAPSNKRMRCVITPTTDAAPGWGGVAFIGLFTTGGELAPCWVFNGALSNGTGGKISGETASHEIGHTVGLFHDGRYFPDGSYEEYYYGNGNWAPIMGASFYPNVTQWSKGEYLYANNSQDDITIIGTNNGFGFLVDETGNTPATSRQLVYSSGSGEIDSSNTGIIGNSADSDVFYFDTPGGTATINVKGLTNFTNLDIGLTLLNSAGTVVATANPAPDLDATLIVVLGAGRYYLSIDGVGNGDPLVDGYSDYGSIGGYTISGNILAGQATCILEEINPAASSFVLRNDYWDFNSGSFVTNECDALKIVHRDYGKEDLWVIKLGTPIQVVNGQTYTIQMDFKDFTEFGVSGIEVGFATGLAPYATQPTLSGSTVIFPTGYSACSFLTKSVNLTAVSTGQVYLVFKLKWSTQPPLQVSTYIKNLTVCPGAVSSSSLPFVQASATIQNNVATQTNCLLEQPNPSAPSFVLRNDYWDFNSGSYVSNQCDALKVVHRDYGKEDLWLIELGTPIQVVNAETYNLKLDFKDFAAFGVSGIEAGFATGLAPYATQPTLSGSTVNFPSGYGCDFVTKSVNLTASFTGQVYLAFKLKWTTQPPVKVSVFIKNLSVCPGAGSTSKIAVTDAAPTIEIETVKKTTISPNPAESDFNAYPSKDVRLLSVSDLQGKEVYTREKITKDSQIKFGENFNLGLYIMSINYEDGTRESFKIIKAK